MNTLDFNPTSKVHHGQNIKKLREMFGIKQEFMACELDTTLQFISKLEQKEVIDDEMLEKVAKVMKLPVDALKNLNDEATFNFISNTFDQSGNSVVSTGSPVTAENYACTFNPLDKVVELYERLLKEKEEKMALLEKMKNNEK